MIGVDVSRYQSDLDYQRLASGGVEFLIAKCSQGVKIDKYYTQHVAGARKFGMVTGAYVWYDPFVSAANHFKTAAAQIEQARPDFIAVDFEQFGFTYKNFLPHVSPKNLYAGVRQVIDAMKAFGLPVVLYTRAWFLQERCPQMINALPDILTWWAWYPFDKPVIECLWQDFRAYWMPKTLAPGWPPAWREDRKDWFIWQMSGDKFVLPGSETKMDVNYYRGTKAEMLAELKSALDRQAGGAKAATVIATKLNVREGPGLEYAPPVDSLKYGAVVTVLETKNGWGRIGENRWISLDWVSM